MCVRHDTKLSSGPFVLVAPLCCLRLARHHHEGKGTRRVCCSRARPDCDQKHKRNRFSNSPTYTFSFLCDCRCWIRVNVRSFYRMLADSPPQWILTYPQEAAPRTGGGLFPGDVIDVVQARRRNKCCSTHTFRASICVLIFARRIPVPAAFSRYGLVVVVDVLYAYIWRIEFIVVSN